jgi:hypothetical protein
MAEAAIVTGASLIGGLVAGEGARKGGEAQARAAENAARAQLGEERRMREEATAVAEPTPEEIAQLNRTIEINEQDIKNKQRILDSVDPAIIEAGKQAAQLLRGEEAASLDPIRKQREKQELKLRETLRQRLGSGYETTSAGIEALRSFETETGMLMTQAQDQAIGRLLGTSISAKQLSNLGSNAAMSGNIANLFGGIQSRRTNAIMGTPIESTGDLFLGERIRGQAQQAASGALGQGISSGATLGGLMLFKQGQKTP